MAAKGKMELTIGVAIGSSIQVSGRASKLHYTFADFAIPPCRSPSVSFRRSSLSAGSSTRT